MSTASAGDIPSNIKYSAKIHGWGFEQVDSKTIVIYSITITADFAANTHHWTVRRRYSEFRDNYLTMGFLHPKSKAARFPFPRKTIFSGINHADDRQDMLQKYLNCLLKIDPVPVQVLYFLRITRNNLGLTDNAIFNHGNNSITASPQKPYAYQNGAVSDDDDDNDSRGSNNEATEDASVSLAGSEKTDQTPHKLRIDDDAASTVPGDESHTPLTSSRRRHIRQLRRSTLHTKAVLRPYTMDHHVFLFDDEVENDDFTYDTSKALKPAVAVTLTVFASQLCILRIMCIFISNKFNRGYFFYAQDNLWQTIKCLFLDYTSAGAVMWVVKTCIFCFVLSQIFHRVVGDLLTRYLQYLLVTPNGGFKMSIKSVVLRLGLIFRDNNEILVNEFIWHNPPKFKETPYFAKITQLRLKFCIKSIWNAIMYRSFIDVFDFEINGLTIYMEKGKRTKDGLNLWACLGSESEEDAKDLRQGFTQKLASVAQDLGGGISHLAGDAAKGFYGGVTTIRHGIGKGVGAIGSGLNMGVHGIGHLVGKQDNHLSDDASSIDQQTYEAQVAANVVVPNTKIEENDDEKLPELEFHWGVPYKIKCANFIARNLTFYVKDFLAARHTEHKPIVIELMGMQEHDLTQKPDHSKNEHGRQPLWLDDLLWRVINTLITELLKGNTLGLLGTLAGSGINQATEQMISTARTGAKQTIQGLYNYNPKEMANATVRGLLHLRNIGAPKFTRSPSMQDLRVDTLTVYLLAIRGLKIANGKHQDLKALMRQRSDEKDAMKNASVRDDGNEEASNKDLRQNADCTCTVKMELKNQPGSSRSSEDQVKMYQYKSGACVPSPETDEYGRTLYEFGEVFDIENLITLNAELYLRVFESSLIKDVTLGEITLPLKDDTISAIIDAEAGKSIARNMVDEHGIVQAHHHPQTKYLFGVREEKVEWYLLYARGSNEIVGEVQVGMKLWNRNR